MKFNILSLFILIIFSTTYTCYSQEDDIIEIVNLLERIINNPSTVSKEVDIVGAKNFLKIIQENPDSVTKEIDLKQMIDLLKRSFLDYEKSIQPDVEAMKELLANIIREPDSLTVFVKSSRFYDTSMYDKILEVENFIDDLENPTNIVNYIKDYNHYGFEFKMNTSNLCARKPNIEKGETYKSKRKYDEIREIAVLFNKQKIGLCISFVFIEGKYYYLSSYPISDGTINLYNK